MKHLIAYGIGGILTTAVNYLIYAGFLGLNFHYLAANTLAWAGAVLFAFWLNRQIIFHSRGSWSRELLSFCSLRFLTLLLENFLLLLLARWLLLPALPSKGAVSLVTVAGNYLFCQKKIFAKGGW